MKKLMLISVCLTILLGACIKEESKEIKKSNTEYLTTGVWYLRAFIINPGVVIGNNTVTDFYATLPACEKDDFQKFYINGTAVTDEGPTKCDPSNPQLDDFTWSLEVNETKLVFDLNQPYDLNKLDANNLILTRVVDGSEIFGGISGQSYKVTLSMTH